MRTTMTMGVLPVTPRFGALSLNPQPIYNLPHHLSDDSKKEVGRAYDVLAARIRAYVDEHQADDFHRGHHVELQPFLMGVPRVDRFLLTSNVQVYVDGNEMLNPSHASDCLPDVFRHLSARIKDAIRQASLDRV